MITCDSIIINKTVSEVYGVAKDLSRQHEFIPGYKPAHVTTTSGGRTVVERVAEINGTVMKWKSLVSLQENTAIHFEQLEGRLKGMKIEWKFDAVPAGTKVTITHILNWNFPVVGWALTTFLVKPTVEKLTGNVLSGLKNTMEHGRRK